MSRVDAKLRPVLSAGLAGLLALAAVPAGAAQDLITVRRLTVEAAQEVAQATLLACRERGYQVSVVVVDRSGDPQALLRDTLAPPYTLQIAADKARAVILSGVDSGSFRRNRADIREEMNHVDGILVLEGGLPIQAAGALVGAVGVSGAPGGDKDAECAREGLAGLQERLEFAD